MNIGVGFAVTQYSRNLVKNTTSEAPIAAQIPVDVKPPLAIAPANTNAPAIPELIKL